MIQTSKYTVSNNLKQEYSTYSRASFVSMAKIKSTLVVHGVSNSWKNRHWTPVGRVRIVAQTTKLSKIEIYCDIDLKSGDTTLHNLRNKKSLRTSLCESIFSMHASFLNHCFLPQIHSQLLLAAAGPVIPMKSCLNKRCHDGAHASLVTASISFSIMLHS